MHDASIKNHPIWVALNQLDQWENSPQFSVPSVANSERHARARDKIFAITKSLQSLLSQSSSLLISVHGLNQLHNSLQQTLSEVSNFISNSNPEHLINAVNHIDTSVIPHFWAFLPSQLLQGPSVPTEMIDMVRRRVNETIETLEGEKDRLLASLKNLNTQFEDQTSKLNQLSEQIVHEKNQSLSVIAELKQQFIETQTKRDTDFNDKLTQWFREMNTAQKEFALKAQGSLEMLAKNESDAKRIVQVVGNIGATGNYQKIAQDETKLADFWRWVTLGVFVFGVLIAICIFFRLKDADLTHEYMLNMVIRLLFAIAITTPAWYTAKESARHRTNADNARKKELELASLGPFIELMPEDKKVSIRETLVPKYFGNESTPHEVNTSVAEITHLVTDAIKATKS